MALSPAAKMCTSKRVFMTIVKAHRAARRRKMRAYLCPRCYFWHLTKKDVK